jgi:hypothetical protein
MTPVDLERAVWERNPCSWFETHGRVMSKKVGVDNANTPVTANWMQVKVGEIVQWCLANDAPICLIIYKPRQKGCSTITVGVAYVLGRLVTLRILVIGGQDSQTDNLWKQLRFYSDTDKADWGNTMVVKDRYAKCSNGTIIERETAGDAEAGRSGTYHIVIATEPARWPTDGKKNAADVLNSVFNCVPQNEPRTIKVMESTANGPVGVFPETWAGAVEFDDFRAGNRGNGYIRVFAPWHVFDDSFVELTDEEKALMPERLRKAKDHKALRLRETLGLPWEKIEYYHRLMLAPECGGDPLKRDKEYPTTPEDGFAASGTSRFDLAGLEALETLCAKSANDLQYGTLECPDRRFPEKVVFRPCEPAQATIVLAEKPMPGCRYLIGTDNMTGRTNVKGDDPDHNAVVVLRDGYYARNGEWVPPQPVAALLPGNTWDMDVLAVLVYRLHILYGRCMVVPERNRGEYLIAELRKMRVLLYEQDRPASEVDYFEPSGDYGWLTTRETKKFLTEEIARHVRNHSREGEGLRLPFAFMIGQCRTFITHPDGTEGAMKVTGCKDDFVIALGICLCCRNASTTYSPPSHSRSMPPDIANLEREDSERRGMW